MSETDRTTFLSGANAEFIAELYTRFLEDQGSVDEGWRRFFGEIGDDAAALKAERAGPPWARSRGVGNGAAAQAASIDSETGRRAAIDTIRAMQLIRAYRVRGHLEADLDPLGLERREHHPELDYRTYGFTEADLDREIFINNLLGREPTTLREIIADLRAIYCGRIGVEYMHIQVLAERQWIQQKFESRPKEQGARPSLTGAAKKEV